MNHLAQRYQSTPNDCCSAAEELVDHIVRMDTHRLELAYRRLAELLDRAQARRTVTLLRTST